jgi:hypothetical protein
MAVKRNLIFFVLHRKKHRSMHRVNSRMSATNDQRSDACDQCSDEVLSS